MTRATTAEPPLSDIDRQALELAIVIGRTLRPDLIDRYLAEKPWLEAAIDASHICQQTKLNLRPWECWPPCAVEVGETDAPGLEHRGISKSAALLARLLAAGLSRYEPDPVNALARVAAGRPQPAPAS
jgi:hypothetical protein